jgi:hypothetical protein
MENLMRGRTVSSLALGLLLSSIIGASAIAQDDPSPNPDECTLEPRTIEEMQALHGTPAPEGEGEAVSIIQATPVDFALPEGEPADEQTVAEVTAAVRNLTACHNAGNYLAGMGGLTDQFIITQVGKSLFDEDFVAAMTSDPVPLAEEDQTVILGIRSVTVLEDGRVAVLFDYHGPTPQVEGIDGVETDLFIFLNVDGAWLLDEVVENVEGTHGPEGIATPAA